MSCRNKKNQKLYDKFKKNVLNNYESIEDYIKISYLKFDTSFSDTNKKEAIKTSQSLNYKLIKNPYPYTFSDKITHYVLFSIEELTKKEQTHIINTTFKPKNFIYFINPDDKKSIKNLWHLHILVQDD